MVHLNKLIYNEVYKVLHKKVTYIFCALVILQFIAVVFMAIYNKNYIKNADRINVQEAKERISKVNLDNIDKLTYIEGFIEDKTIVESYKYYKKYGTDSWQRYLFDEDVYPNIKCMMSAKYKKLDHEVYTKCREAYIDKINEIDSNDWKYFVNKYQDDAIKELTELQESYDEAENELTKKSIMLSIKAVQLEIDGYKYHLLKDVPIDYSPKSAMIADYVSNATVYLNLELDESKYKEYYELKDKRETEKIMFESKYRIDNDLEPLSSYTSGNMFISYTCISIIMVIVYMLMVSGTIVSEEFNKGTIKQLLVRPYSRYKIIISKLLGAIIVSLMFLIFYIFVAFIFCGIAYGFKGYFIPVVIYDFGKQAVVHMSIFQYLIISTLSYIPQYLILITLSMFLGVFILNEALAIGIPILALLVSSYVLPYTNMKFLKYFPTMCWNFNDFLWGGLPSFRGLELKINIIVSILTFILFVIAIITVFKNKDVKNQ